jgi:hypothetical protein
MHQLIESVSDSGAVLALNLAITVRVVKENCQRVIVWPRLIPAETNTISKLPIASELA